MPAVLFGDTPITYKSEPGSVTLNGERIEYSVLRHEPGRMIVKVGNSVREILYVTEGDKVGMYAGGATLTFRVLGDRDLMIRSLKSDTDEHHSLADVRAPMPGLVVNVCVSAGEKIARGTTVVILEAMKMENEIKSTREGDVAEILVARGNIVEKDQVLARLG